MKIPTIDRFRKEYIWGFTQGNPIRHSQDKEAFSKLISPLSKSGTITIGASFHPYHLLDGKGNDLWEIFYQVIEKSGADLQGMVDRKSIFHIDAPSIEHFPIVKWNDERLFIERNPEFGKYVPFVIPFLAYNDGEDPIWLTRIQTEMKEKYTAQDFIEEVNKVSRFFLPEPSFILGFDQFDKGNPSQLVDHYVRFLDNVINKNNNENSNTTDKSK